MFLPMQENRRYIPLMPSISDLRSPILPRTVMDGKHLGTALADQRWIDHVAKVIVMVDGVHAVGFGQVQGHALVDADS